MSVKYSDSFMTLVNELTKINKSVIVVPDEDKINVKMSDPNKSLVYDLNTTKESFGVEEEIGFYNFVEFYSFYTTLKNGTDIPSLSIKDNKICLTGDNSKLNYNLSDVEILKTHRPKNVSFADWDYEFTLDQKIIQELTKMISLINASYIKMVSHEDGYVTIKVYSNGVDNAFEKRVELTKVSETEDAFDFDIIADQINKIPSGSYKFQVKNPGRIKVSLVTTGDTSLDIYIARKKEA